MELGLGEDGFAMRCPTCGGLKNRVVDSRLSKEGRMIRRRRSCATCGRRFTTYERVEEAMPMVVKKDGRREPFDSDKLLTGIGRACEKRPVSVAEREAVVNRIKLSLQEMGEKEVPSMTIGEKVMEELFRLDKVAYVRFASVYRSFDDVSEFVHEIERLLKQPGSARTK